MSADVVITRRALPAHHSLSLLPRIWVERGNNADWKLLHELHYKAENNGIGPKVWRCVLDGHGTIGAGVMTVPKMLLSGRNHAFEHMKPNQGGRDTPIMNRHRALWMNAHSCTNARLVLDTMYRGAGIAYRMQNLMMRLTGCRLVEFQSSMSKFNPFAAKAGIQFTPPRRSSYYEKGLAFFKRWFACHPSDYVGIMQELEAMTPGVQARCVDEMRKFYYKCSSMEKSGDNRANGTRRVDAMAVGYLVKSLQQLTLASPLYGVYQNPDFDLAADALRADMPERLPLLAFDLQGANEPLDMARVHALLAQQGGPCT